MTEIEKRADEVLELEFDFTRDLEVVWRSGEVYQSDAYIRPTVPNGFEYQATDGGQSSAREPKWPTSIGGTVIDGSVVWTCVDFGSNATDTVSSHSVTSDSGITIDNVDITDAIVRCSVSGGSGCHDVVCQVTTSGGETLALVAQVVIQ